ncbi:unnamed protein product, partial [Iphiclides podalirius]
MATKLIFIAVICVAIGSQLTQARRKREAPLSANSDAITATRNLQWFPGNGRDYKDPRNLYNTPNIMENGVNPDGISIQDLLELGRRQELARRQNRPLPDEYVKQQLPYSLPRNQHVHHHIHYSLMDVLKIMEMLGQGGQPNNPGIYNFADAEGKTTTTEGSNPADEVVFGEENCPTGYTRISDKCVKDK